ncbi:MAG: histidinol-phosphatase [Oscillospiraceae bacterium]|nr:histidinol-phosphatase [Oscillospiraceae bacterium]
MRANYHTHTPRCNHAEGAERSYVERALAGGFQELGFSDHTPYFFDKPGYYSTFRMKPELLPDYVDILLALRAEYAGRIKLHIGLEAEYYPRLFPRLLDYLRQFPLDYLILGQHGLFNETEGLFSTRPTDDAKLLDQYRGQTLEALETGLFTYFAHPDLFFFTGDRKVYERHVRAICRKALELSIPLEFNLLGFSEEKHYPDLFFWRIVGEEGCAVILGSDAHSPMETWSPDLISKAETLLAGFGIRPIERATLHPIR